MKNYYILLLFLLFNVLAPYAQTSTQMCANIHSQYDYDYAVLEGKFYFSDYQVYSDGAGYSLPKKMNVRWYFNLPEVQSTVDGLPLIAENHIEKFRFKTWFDQNHPSNRLNGYGRNIYLYELKQFYDDLKVLPLLTVEAGYTPSDISLFLGGEDNFPENAIFDNIKFTFYVYVKQEYAHLYPGGTTNRIYQMKFGITDSITGTNYFSRPYRQNIDSDQDGILNVNDNCRTVYNPNQEDNDNDGIGNACDNCINNANSNQMDSDGDGIGNACESDDDNDGILDNNDNCPTVSNSNQLDTDNDGIGDACDEIDNNALPNLILSGFKVKVNNTTYNPFNGQTPTLKYNNTANFEVTINNDQNGIATGSPFEILVSSGANAYPNTDGTPVYGFISSNAGSLNPNQSSSVTINQYINTFIGGLNLQENFTYYMYLHIDPNDSVDETENITDNIWIFPFKYDDGNASNGRFAYLDLGNGSMIETPLDNVLNSSKRNESIKQLYNVKIYKYNTLELLMDVDVTSGALISALSLTSGTYIVHVNDVYVKKFIKLTGGIIPIGD